MLIMDQKVTTHHVLGELDQRGVKFLTLRMRSPDAGPADQRPATLGLQERHPGPARPAQQTPRPRGPRRHPDRLPGHRPATRRHRTRPRGTHRDHHQRTAGQHPRPDHPLRPSNDHRTTPRRDHPRVLRRRPVLHREPQRRPGHHAHRARPGPDRRAPRARLPGYATITPDTIQRRFLETPGTIITTTDSITVHLERRAYTPTLRKAELPTDTRIPWLGNKTIRYELR